MIELSEASSRSFMAIQDKNGETVPFCNVQNSGFSRWMWKFLETPIRLFSKYGCPGSGFLFLVELGVSDYNTIQNNMSYVTFKTFMVENSKWKNMYKSMQDTVLTSFPTFKSHVAWNKLFGIKFYDFSAQFTMLLGVSASEPDLETGVFN